MAMVARVVLAALPAESVTAMPLPSVPVYREVTVRSLVPSVALAAVSVPSVTRTTRKLAAP